MLLIAHFWTNTPSHRDFNVLMVDDNYFCANQAVDIAC